MAFIATVKVVSDLVKIQIKPSKNNLMTKINLIETQLKFDYTMSIYKRDELHSQLQKCQQELWILEQELAKNLSK